ncbi:phosphopantetheine-binding protein [Halalkalibacter alkalisediminis]|uniref:Phosphopantetheine-binding protein n=1 Tax=Halalkalibacter alkalisediminis TaxID=935616 RepID=A0ABV6NN66_9BACI|nr:phosphopantetheine-binding protein [Halalkalibacter alkalisediminis]
MEITTTSKTEAIEKKLIEFWGEILGEESIDRNVSFFDLGGNSLLAMQLIQMVKNNLGIKLAIKVLFEHPTIEELSLLIKQLSDINQGCDK